MSVPSVASKSWKVVRYHASSYTDGNAKLDRAWKQQQLLSTSSTSSSSSPSSSLVACYNGGNVTLLDLSTGHIARTIQAEADDEFVTFTLSPTQQLLATLSRRTSQLTLHSTSDASTVTSVRLSAYHSLPISSLAFDPSARYIVTASHDRTLRIFDLHHTPAPQLVHTLRGHSQPITLATFHPAARRLQLVSGDDSGQLRVWSLATGDCQTLSSEHLAAITCITFTSGSSSSGGNSDGHMITAGRDKVICVWDVKHAYKCIRTITAFETVDSLLPWPLSAAVPQAEEGKKAEKKRPTVVFVSGGEKGLLRWWDGETGKELYQYALPSLLNTAATAASAPTSTSPSAADKFIANQIAHLLLLPLSPPPAEPSSSIAATAPFHVIAVTREQNFHVFAPLPTLTPVTLYVGHNDEIIDLRFIPTLNDSSSPQAVVVTNSPQPRVFDLTTLSASLLSGHSDVVLAVDVSTDGRFITTASKDRTVRVWTPAVGKPGGGWKCVAVCEGHTESVGAVGVSKSGKGSSGKLFVVSGARDRTLKMWDAAALSKLTGEGKEGKDDQAEIVSLSCVSTRVAHEKDINSIAVSPNDKLIASGSEDRTIHLFSTAASSASSTTTTTTTATLTSVATLKGHRRGVWSLRFSPVDRVLASASGDKTIRIWSLVDYTCVKVLEGHNGSVKTLSWLRGGLHVVSGGDDGLLKCWLVKTSECVGTWTVPVHETGGEVGTEAGEEDETVGEKVWALDVSADGRMLLTGGVASVLNVWQDVTEEEAEERRTEQSVQLGREQRLANAIRRKEWKEAMDIALSLKQPRRLHTVLVEVLKEGRQGDDGGEAKIAELVCALDEERMDVLLTYVRDWNSNSKTAMVANVVLQLLFKHFPLSTLQKKKLLTDSLPGMVRATSNTLVSACCCDGKGARLTLYAAVTVRGVACCV